MLILQMIRSVIRLGLWPQLGVSWHWDVISLHEFDLILVIIENMMRLSSKFVVHIVRFMIFIHIMNSFCGFFVINIAGNRVAIDVESSTLTVRDWHAIGASILWLEELGLEMVFLSFFRALLRRAIFLPLSILINLISIWRIVFFLIFGFNRW
jgi:hypothetical protein